MPSHGSLSKAGKVRAITPKVEGKERHSSGPRVTNSGNYHKRVELDRGVGQYKPGQRRRRRRRR
ncbi:MAG: 30S ribosomal protein S30e [archaeon]|jgi:small subunit ribosomal protein S30e|nr:30S ribosomal protein S30e [Candidatus Bathyarchaeum sp.]